MSKDAYEKEKQAPVQTRDEGAGDTYHRLYTIRIAAPFAAALQTMKRLQATPDQFSPQLLATFEKIEGEANKLAPGDRFQIHITGPWNGPVVVKDVSDKGFSFLTLEGHLEAGEIHFRVVSETPHETVFQIESLARSRDRIVDFVYDKIPIAKAAQTTMWAKFCQCFAEETQKNAAQTPDASAAEVIIKTEKMDQKTKQWVEV